LFKNVRDEMDTAFDTLPPPTPTLRPPSPPYVDRRVRPYGHVAPRARGRSLGASSSASYTPVKSMVSWNKSSAPCFAGHCRVALASNIAAKGKFSLPTITVEELKRGMQVLTRLGPRRVVSIIRTAIPNSYMQMCQLGDLVITPYHPVHLDGKWSFPADLFEPQETACEAVYSLLLEPDDQPDAHAVTIEGVTCITLGHGLVVPTGDGFQDVRVHAFLGDYEKVLQAIAGFPGFDGVDGIVHTRGVVRSSESGLITGLAKPLSGIASLGPSEVGSGALVEGCFAWVDMAE